LNRASPTAVATNGDPLRRITRQIDQTLEATARLSGSNVSPGELYSGVLQKTVTGIEAPAGAIWLKTPQGFLQLQHQINLTKVGMDDSPEGRQSNNGILARVFQNNQATVLDPGAKMNAQDGAEPPMNRTHYPVVVVPIMVEEKVSIGLLQIWLDPTADPRLRGPFINFIIQMTGYISNYVRNNSNRRTSLQEQIYIQLEAFSKQVHSSLNPTEVGFNVANEGRRLIGCDRITVGVQHGRRTTVEAVSGADVVEKSSTQIKMMRYLFDAVLEWNEKLVYRGSRDETLPPKVLSALDNYLAESSAKLLILQPLRDEREKDKDKDKEGKYLQARSALLMECYEPPEPPEPLVQKFDVVCSHAASALYNASEVKRIPFRLLWRPMQALQARAGGKRRFYTMIIGGLVLVLLAALIFVPYPLKLDAKGQLVPEDRNYIYPTGTGRVIQFKVKPGDIVRTGTEIAVMFDAELATEVSNKLKEIKTAESEVLTLRRQAVEGKPEERAQKAAALTNKETELRVYSEALQSLEDIRKANRKEPGNFTVVAPEFRPARNARNQVQYKVVTSDYIEQLTNKWVKPNEPLLRVGNVGGAWLIEMKIPQKHISQVRKAFKTNDPNEYLEVDLLVTSAPTQPFRGRLYQKDLGAEAKENKDEHDQSEPIVYAYVRVNEDDMPEEEHIPVNLLVTGVEVHTKIRAGSHALGYCLFYGLWEFFYEKVVFFF
jgi:hypothetical protein